MKILNEYVTLFGFMVRNAFQNAWESAVLLGKAFVSLLVMSIEAGIEALAMVLVLILILFLLT